MAPSLGEPLELGPSRRGQRRGVSLLASAADDDAARRAVGATRRTRSRLGRGACGSLEGPWRRCQTWIEGRHSPLLRCCSAHAGACVLTRCACLLPRCACLLTRCLLPMVAWQAATFRVRAPPLAQRLPMAGSMPVTVPPSVPPHASSTVQHGFRRRPLRDGRTRPSSMRRAPPRPTHVQRAAASCLPPSARRCSTRARATLRRRGVSAEVRRGTGRGGGVGSSGACERRVSG